MTCHIGREVSAARARCRDAQVCGPSPQRREGACRDRQYPPSPLFFVSNVCCQGLAARVSSHRQIGDHNTGSARALDPALQSHCSKTTAALPHCSSNLRTTGEHHLVHLLFDALLIRADRLVGELPSSSVVSDHSLSWKYDRFER